MNWSHQGSGRWAKSGGLVADVMSRAPYRFSIVQRKALMPNEFEHLEAVAARLLSFQTRYEQLARPFEWTFTREDLTNILARLSLGREAAA